ANQQREPVTRPSCFSQYARFLEPSDGKRVSPAIRERDRVFPAPCPLVRTAGIAAPVAAIAFVVLWFVSGPLYGWSNAWQLIVNTTSSIITLVMVFLIQHTQRRDTQAIQLKLDELIRVNSEAGNELISLEAKPDTAVEEMREASDELREEVEDEVRPRGRR